MTPRMDYFSVAPEAVKAMRSVESYLQKCGLDKRLMELVKMRASQINGCAYCIHLHRKVALAAGESEERLLLLPAWRESPLFSPRERAALAWTEALTRVSETHAPDADYAEAERRFSAEELVNLTLAIGAINVWNRLSIGFRTVHPVEEPAS